MTSWSSGKESRLDTFPVLDEMSIDVPIRMEIDRLTVEFRTQEKPQAEVPLVPVPHLPKGVLWCLLGLQTEAALFCKRI